MDYSETELTEAFMDKWIIVGITCGVILGVIVIVTIVSLLVCFIWRQEKDSSKSERYRNKDSKNGSDSDSNRKKSSSYGPTLGNPTQPYYVQPSDDRKLAPSAEMFHYQYQKDQNNTNLPYPSAPTMPQPLDGNDYLYEVPGLAPPRGDDKEVVNPLYDK
ncbi:unnamed protein product [Hymenolepis diminuta]|uniref:Uncharacterized protein n=1 Tax=Hymenolepis diminuta TaxID=6216 RepID=A0A564YTC9_HYMDI|nr:unnamed protein product [Hymenolepis diminuta]